MSVLPLANLPVVNSAYCAFCKCSAAEGPSTGCPGPIQILNTSICPLTQAQCVDSIMKALQQGRGGWVVTPNLDHVRRSATDSTYAHAIREAELRVADGMPLIWASRLQGTPLPERVAGSDLIYALSRGLSERKGSVFLLGGDPGTAESSAKVLAQSYPGLAIAGICCPPMGFENDPILFEEIKKQIVDSRADVVFVALGSPKQEYLIRRLRNLLPRAWWIGVGITFSFVCGNVRRAPRWMQRWGLEWIHRLIQEPRRLAARYLFHGMPFGLKLLVRSAFRERPTDIQRHSA